MTIRRCVRRNLKRLRPEMWLAALLLIFVSSQYILSGPAMQLQTANTQVHSHGQMHKTQDAPSKPAKHQHQHQHQHQQCQLCMAPPLALAVTDLSQLGKSRLELLEAVLHFGAMHVRQPTTSFVLSRAPPAA